MPMTKVYLRPGSSSEHRRVISQAIHESLMQVLGIPSDDLYHVFHELGDGYLFSAPVAFGLDRRDEAVFIQFYFGPRPVEVLQQLFADVVKRLGDLAGLETRDIYLNVVPTPTEYWWADGRILDPGTGFDVRIAGDKVPPRSSRNVQAATIAAGVPRLLVIGGASSLYGSDGRQLIESFTPPEPYASGVRAARDYHAEIRAETRLDWTYLSPPMECGPVGPDGRTGRYRTGTDHPVIDEHGKSSLSRQDLAVAVVDEAERPAHLRQRFTVGY